MAFALHVILELFSGADYDEYVIFAYPFADNSKLIPISASIFKIIQRLAYLTHLQGPQGNSDIRMHLRVVAFWAIEKCWQSSIVGNEGCFRTKTTNHGA